MLSSVVEGKENVIQIRMFY